MKEIYLDAHASTPVDANVIDAMMPYFTRYFGNGNHRNGWQANQALEVARLKVAQLIGAYPGNILFTSGATEAINIGLIGLAKLYPEKKHIITQPTEHPAVLETIRFLEKQGYAISYLPLDAYGIIDIQALEKAITPNTLCVAIMLANNEIGSMQPIEAIGKICKATDTRFFCDITQGAGWYPVDVDMQNIDMAVFSAHKIYGPKGNGALYYRGSISSLPPLLHGGGQEKGVRSGTVNIPGIVGFAKACELMKEQRTSITDHLLHLRNHLWHLLSSSLEEITVNGSMEHRHPGNLNVRIKGVNSESLIGKLQNIMLSNSSACSSGSTKPSHVLTSLQLTEAQARECVRIGIGKYNTLEEIEFTAGKIIEAVNKLRRSWNE
jgi:cysteine desulfurase